MAFNFDTVHDLLSQEREKLPDELEHFFLQFEDFWERKLWHELTNALLEFFELPESINQRKTLYDTFISSFAEKINQLKLVTLGLSAASQCKDNQSRLSFISSLASKVNKPDSQDAFVYATVAEANIKLQLGDTVGAREKLDGSERILELFDSVETIVHASFYRVNAEYHKVKQEFAAYYKNMLLYLACIDLSTLAPGERLTRAYDLSVAALVSDTIYNFGELLLHPILDSLKDSSHSWLRDLLFAYNRGDLIAYDSLSINLSKDNLLNDRKIFLRQKISLSALTEIVFQRPPHDRTMTFQSISQETKVQPDAIEHLIMKALSLGLLKGTMDQVAEIARINWVQPKVLGMSQISNMRTRLEDWDSNVNQLGTWIESVGKDVWAA